MLKPGEVYNEVVKLIIQFIVSIDEKIIDQAQYFMSVFLTSIFTDITTISNCQEQAPQTKLKLETYITLIKELFSET